jgi:hypothetical protein
MNATATLNKRMRLVELHERPSREYTVLAKALQGKLGRLVRIGGNRRVYKVNQGDEKCAVLLVDGTTRAFGLAWSVSNMEAGISTIYVWKSFDINSSPDYALTVPTEGDTETMIDSISKWIKNPASGALNEAALPANDDVEPDDSSSTQPIQPIQPIGAPAPPVELSEPAKLSRAPTGPVAAPKSSERDFDDMLNLAQAKNMRKVASIAPNRIRLQARNADGVWMDLEGLSEYSAKLERAMTKELVANGDEAATMASQYKELQEKIEIVASGKSAFVRSILVMGAPSSGKSFNVKSMLKKLGLTNGNGYVLKTGKITPAALWRTLIEQIDGMVVFDDCDGVAKDKDAVNILKGALDTTDVREISYDGFRTMNTSTMDAAVRDDLVRSMSRILRNEATQADLDKFTHLLKKDKDETPKEPEPFDPRNFSLKPKPVDAELLAKVQKYIVDHPPNMIDFKGRVIFISNLDESVWDSIGDGAITSRSMTINMKFSSGEMLDYIDEIKDNIKTPGLTDDQKQEVMDFIRDMFITGKLTKQINFRLVQQAFDMRIASNWKNLVAKL